MYNATEQNKKSKSIENSVVIIIENSIPNWIRKAKKIKLSERELIRNPTPTSSIK